MTIKTVTYEYHHTGIPTQEVQEGEKYSSTFKMYTSGGQDSEFRVQYHRFEEGCPLHPLIQTRPHIAFKVNSIDAAIKNKEVILAPHEPIKGFKVAMIVEKGAPIELIETTLSEEEIWSGEHKNSVIYPEEGH